MMILKKTLRRKIMNKLKLVEVKDDGTEKILKDDIKNIVFVAEIDKTEDNQLDFGFTNNKLKTEKLAFMKFVFERETTKMLNDNYGSFEDFSNPGEVMKKIFDMM